MTQNDQTDTPVIATLLPERVTGRGRGFASMDPERRREIARKGGASTPADQRSFAKNRELAVSAGRKGGSNSRKGKE